MVHSGALVSHYLLRPLSSAAAVVAAAPIATVLDHSSSSSKPLPRLPSLRSCVNLQSASIDPKPSKPALVAFSLLLSSSSSLSSNILLYQQQKSTSILNVLQGKLLERNTGEKATRKQGRLVYEAHSPYRSATVRKVSPPSKTDCRPLKYLVTGALGLSGI